MQVQSNFYLILLISTKPLSAYDNGILMDIYRDMYLHLHERDHMHVHIHAHVCACSSLCSAGTGQLGWTTVAGHSGHLDMTRTGIYVQVSLPGQPGQARKTANFA
jgi:hypothetical protein